MDDANGDRGDVAPPAGNMPRSNGHSEVPGSIPPGTQAADDGAVDMDSRCKNCGADLSMRDMERGGHCAACESAMAESATHPINPNNIQPPKGSAPAPGKSIGAIHAGDDVSTEDTLASIDAELAEDPSTNATVDSLEAELTDMSLRR